MCERWRSTANSERPKRNCCHLRSGDDEVVDFMDTEAVLELVKAPGVREVADDVGTRMEQVRDTLANGWSQ